MPRGDRDYSYGLKIYYGDSTPWATRFDNSQRADCWSSVPVLDVTGDGRADIISGRIARTAQAKLPEGWTSAREMDSGYQTAWADVDGDGDLEGFTPRLDKLYHVTGRPPGQDVMAVDHQGKPLTGWPQAVDRLSTFVVAGDISGDEKMEILAIDWGGNLRAWTPDGQGVPGSKTTTDALGRELRGQLRGGMSGWVAPSLADLDGDGKAEIIALSGNGELLTLKGDGSSWGVGTLGRVENRAGVAVADLDGDGEMDVFAGNKWIRLTKNGPVSADIVPRDAPIASAPTLCDLDGDGKAEVLLTSQDGRVWVFQTDREIKPEWLQWQTANGNARQNAVWVDPRKITPAIATWARGRFSPNE